MRRESKSRGEGKEWECEFIVRHIVYSERLFIIGGRKRDGELGNDEDDER